MDRRRAGRDGGRVPGADRLGQLALERVDVRPERRDPVRSERFRNVVLFRSAHMRRREQNGGFRHRGFHALPLPCLDSAVLAASTARSAAGVFAASSSAARPAAAISAAARPAPAASAAADAAAAFSAAVPLMTAGTPAAVQPAGTSRVTTAPAPAVDQAPTVRPGMMTPPAPTNAPSPARTPPVRMEPGAAWAQPPTAQSWPMIAPVVHDRMRADLRVRLARPRAP